MKSTGPILVMLMSVLAFYFYFIPKYQDVVELQELNNEYRSAISRSNDLRDKVSETFSRFETFNTLAVSNLNMVIPRSIDNTEFSNYISGIAGRNNASITSMSFSRPAPRRGQNDTQPYSHVSAEISLVANYQNILNFLIDIEGSLMKLDVVSFSIRPQTDGFYAVNMTIQAYELKSN